MTAADAGADFSQDDAHIFTPFESVEDEIFRFLDFTDTVRCFRLHRRGDLARLRPEKRIGSDEQ